MTAPAEQALPEHHTPLRRSAPDQAAVPVSGGMVSWKWGLVVLIVGQFLSVLEVSIVNIALPVMQNDFGTTNDKISWVTTSFSLALGVITPASGWVGERIGLRRAYLIALLGFAVACGMCAAAWDLPSMVLARIVQAVPAGMLPVLSLAMLYKIVPTERIGISMGLYSLGVFVAPAIGPTLGGYLVEYQTWRWIFLVNIPVALAGAAACLPLLPVLPRPPKARFDLWGFLTVATGLFALLLALSQAQLWGWGSYRILMLLVGAGLSLALFVIIELEVDAPLLDVRVFAVWPFTQSLLLIATLTLGLFAVIFYLPLYMQEGQGHTALNTGLTFLPEAATMGAVMPLSGWWFGKSGPRWPTVIGLAVSAYSTFLIRGINPDMTTAQVMWWTSIRGIGNGLAMVPVFTGGVAALSADKVTQAGAINNIVQRVTTALGLAVLTAIATHRAAQHLSTRVALIPASIDPVTADQHRVAEHGYLGLYSLYQNTQLAALAEAYSDVFWIVGILTLAGTVLALFVTTPPPVGVPGTPPPPGQTPALAPSPHVGPASEINDREDLAGSRWAGLGAPVGAQSGLPPRRVGAERSRGSDSVPDQRCGDLPEASDCGITRCRTTLHGRASRAPSIRAVAGWSERWIGSR